MLPEKSHPAKQTPERRPLTVVQENCQISTKQDCYKSFKELCERTKKLKNEEQQDKNALKGNWY